MWLHFYLVICKDGTVVMDERFKRPDVYFEDEGRRLFPNGTILHTNGTEETGLVFWGAMDPWYEDCQLI